ncbi:MAG: Na+/H+ antiporter [Anaerolineae bacterium]|nr:Na+/H+ antiporter [Anaerolineae bacterium]
MGEGIVQIETLIIELLVLVSLVALVVKRLRIPYTVALVIAGLIVGLAQPVLEQVTGPIEVSLTSELILALFVPPLIFEAAFNLNFNQLHRNLPIILVLAIPGVLLTMLIVGVITSMATTLTLQMALVFGALIAATDPVAVIALFRSLGVPKRLAVLVEGESLLNDGAAIVVFGVMLTVVETGTFDLAEGLLDFIIVVIGGLSVGIILGGGVAWLISRIDDHLIETTLTVALAFGTFLLAERLHVSGVLAVVTAGLLNGNASEKSMSPTTSIILDNFWEYIAFLANSLIFLIIGLEVNIFAFSERLGSILVAIAAVTVARVIVVYGGAWLTNRFAEPLSLRWQHVISWGGLRGAVSLALALSLPASLGANRTFIIELTFGVVLFTLFVQGTTLGPILRRLRIIAPDEGRNAYELNHARLVILQESIEHVNTQYRQGLVSQHTREQLTESLGRQTKALSDQISQMFEQYPELAQVEMSESYEEVLRHQRRTLLRLRREGTISEETFEELAIEVDTILVNTERRMYPE